MKLLILLILVLFVSCTQKVLCPTYQDTPSKPGSGYFKPKSR